MMTMEKDSRSQEYDEINFFMPTKPDTKVIANKSCSVEYDLFEAKIYQQKGTFDGLNGLFNDVFGAQ